MLKVLDNLNEHVKRNYTADSTRVHKMRFEELGISDRRVLLRCSEHNVDGGLMFLRRARSPTAVPSLPTSNHLPAPRQTTATKRTKTTQTMKTSS